NIFLQSHSLGPLAPNIVLSGWPVNEDRIEAFFRHLNTIRLLRMNILVLINPERASDEPGDGPIDIWWRGRQNGSLMLILAHLLTCSRPWHKTKIRLLRLADPETRPEAERELAQLAADSRIEAVPEEESSGIEIFDRISKVPRSRLSLAELRSTSCCL
ncbi:MAG: hypothetical protein IKS85_00640, partial [Lachnospiraceae bacterium]|nr:hypothetical protein [Lachnospiraceae bacterium]